MNVHKYKPYVSSINNKYEIAVRRDQMIRSISYAYRKYV